MPIRPLNREQAFLLPPSLDDLIPQDHPARFIAGVVDSLDESFWEELGIEFEGDALGAPAYHPRALLSVWLYGFATGTRSSRKLEAACRDQMPCLWLTGWQRPDHNTLWRFYKLHREEMRRLFKLSVKTAVKMGLVDLAIQAVDGTKMGANASKRRTYDAKELRKLLGRTEEAIWELEKENEEGRDPAPIHLPEKLRDAERLRKEVKAAIEELEEQDKKETNLTDRDARLMNSRQGFIAGYNVEAVSSPLKKEEAGRSGMLLTAIDATQDRTDHAQLTPMLEQAEDNVGKKVDTLADAGFHSGSNLATCAERKQIVVMPEAQERALRDPYHKDAFSYDAEKDTYKCPCGQSLRFVRVKTVGNRVMRIYRGSKPVCLKCKAFGVCTRNRHGRELQVGRYEAVLRRHREWMATKAAQEAYARRQGIVEPVFGIIKEQMGIRRFFLRGLDSVRAEATMLAVAFNLRTLYSIWRGWSTEKRSRLAAALRESEKRVDAAAASLTSTSCSLSMSDA